MFYVKWIKNYILQFMEESNMDMEEFKYLVDKIEYLSNKCAGLKVQNKQLTKEIKKLKYENNVLNGRTASLSSKLTELNHENNRLKEQYQTQNGLHGKIHIKEAKNE